MISRNTVFVLGAGAHAPYGFPIGDALLAKILTLLAPDRAASSSFSAFTKLVLDEYGTDIPLQSFVDFRVALSRGGHTSIDSFLATNATRPGFAEIGKLAIAYVLLPLDLQRDFSRGSIALDWMSYLFSNMLKGCHRSIDEFLTNNNLSFITFNYDRTLEHFLCVRIKHTYNVSYEEAWGAAQRLPVVHVYGSLGEFDPRVIDRQPPTGITPGAYKKAAEAIRLMYDDREERSVDVKNIKLLLEAADCVCFLGFGFDVDNISYLRLNELCQPSKAVFATRYRVANGDWNRMKKSMLPTEIRSDFAGHIDWDSLGLLQQTQAIG